MEFSDSAEGLSVPFYYIPRLIYYRSKAVGQDNYAYKPIGAFVLMERCATSRSNPEPVPPDWEPTRNIFTLVPGPSSSTTLGRYVRAWVRIRLNSGSN